MALPTNLHSPFEVPFLESSTSRLISRRNARLAELVDAFETAACETYVAVLPHPLIGLRTPLEAQVLAAMKSRRKKRLLNGESIQFDEHADSSLDTSNANARYVLSSLLVAFHLSYIVYSLQELDDIFQHLLQKECTIPSPLPCMPDIYSSALVGTYDLAHYFVCASCGVSGHDF